MAAPNNTPINPNASYFKVARDYVQKNNPNNPNTWQEFIDRINQSPELVQAINSWQTNGGQITGIIDNGQYDYSNRSLGVSERRLSNASEFSQFMGHEIYGHDGDRDFVINLFDPKQQTKRGHPLADPCQVSK